LSVELGNAIDAAQTLQLLEDIYRPFKEKKNTRAASAIAAGLQPLANILQSGRLELAEFKKKAQEFVKESIKTADEAVQGAKDILAEAYSDDPREREHWRKQLLDYSSFEMRILAELSGDEKFIKALREDLDLHSYTAALMFGLEYTDDFKKKYPDKRQAAKAINFGLMYGMGPSRLAVQIDVTKEEAVGMMEKYFASYPSVRDFLAKMAKNAVRNGWSSTPAGRKRWYKTPDSSDPDYKKKIGSIERQAKNHPIQGTNADAVKYALVFLHDRLKKDGIDGGITHTVHDEIVSEIREDQAEYWAKVQSEEMCRAAKLFITKVPVVSDPFVGDVWEH
jgi:DNA polymerase I-like protein with 3'-5' exonuclease and polymerase domains